MNGKKWRRSLLAALMAGGCLFGGPCGITTLQLQDFVSSTLIRTFVTTAASLVEAAVIEGSQSQTTQ